MKFKVGDKVKIREDLEHGDMTEQEIREKYGLKNIRRSGG